MLRYAAPVPRKSNPAADRAAKVAARKQALLARSQPVPACLRPVESQDPVLRARARDVAFELVRDGDAERLRSRQRAVELRPALVEELAALAFGAASKLKLAAALGLLGIAETVSPLASKGAKLELERTTSPDGSITIR